MNTMQGGTLYRRGATSTSGNPPSNGQAAKSFFSSAHNWSASLMFASDSTYGTSMNADISRASVVLPVEGGPSSSTPFFGMIRKLHKDHGLPVPSPRRTKLMLKLAAANAWLAGASTVDVAHLDILTTALPHTPDDQDAVDQVVLAVAAPNREQIRKEAVKAAALVVDYAKAVDIVEDAARTEAYVQAYTRAQKCALALTRLEQGATPADLDDINAVWPALQEVHARFTTERLNQTTVTDFRAEARAGRINVRYRG